MRTTIFKWVGMFILDILLLVLILFLFELIFNPYKKLPRNGLFNGKKYTWGYIATNNKLGFREKEIKTPKPSNVFRIMVIGDSLTWGPGLSYDQRYTAIAEKKINSSNINTKVEILNFGVPGGPAILYKDILFKYYDYVQPDLIVIGFCLNDTQPKSQNYSPERIKLQNSFLGKMISILTHTLNSIGLHYTGELVDEIFYKIAEVLGFIPNWQTSLNRTYMTSSNEWKSFIDALMKIKIFSDEKNLPPPFFVILNQGTYTDRPTDYRFPNIHLQQYLKWYHQAETAAKNIGFVIYNHEKEISEILNNESLAINIVDCHPSVNLNRIYGEKLASMILSHRKRIFNK